MGHPQYLDYPQPAATVQDAERIWNHGGPGANTAWDRTVEAIQYKLDYDTGTVVTPPPTPAPAEEETPKPPLVKYADLIERIKTDMQNPNYPGEVHDLSRVLKTLGVAEYADYNGGAVGVQEATNRRTRSNDNPHWEGIAEAIAYAQSYSP